MLKCPGCTCTILPEEQEGAAPLKTLEVKEKVMLPSDLASTVGEMS